MNSNFPLGFRFHPTENQLIQYYLIPKVNGEKLPLDAIMDLDVYQFDPEQLPMNHCELTRDNVAFFFTESTEEDNSIRATPSGYWSAYKKHVIVFEGSNIIGFKNKYVFFNGRYPDGDETKWKIAEYRCSPTAIPTIDDNKNLVVCKVHHKINEEEEEEEDYDELLSFDEDEDENEEDDDNDDNDE
ncbi:NAC domain-containing protein 13-like [Henckelia pumila]|uniref:NAC domain-containing protein 13-like n=1 Tax=Henckelia pumila TaxID=405737 RepID=UPI003C6DED8A